MPGQATRFLYDGQETIAEYDVNNNLLRRYVHGPGTDEPLVWYEGSGTSSRRHLFADRQGSIVATAGDAGTVTAINAYDEYGLPNTTMTGRFGYTGQKFLSEVGLYDYKARIYSPTLGRFMSPDPTGYGDGMNFYSYAHANPVNETDPSGLGYPCGGTVTYGADNSVNFVGAGCPNGMEQPGPGNLSTPGSTDGGEQRPDRPSPQSTTTHQGLGAPSNPKKAACYQAAFGDNIGGIGLDAAGFLISGITAPESLVAAGVGLGVATASLVNSAVHSDVPGVGIGAASYHLAAFTPAAARAATSGSAGLARFIPGFGLVVSGLSLARDARELNKALAACDAANP